LSGERLTDAECETVLKDCMDPEDEDGFIPYARKYRFVLDRECVPFPRRDRQRMSNHLHHIR